MRVDILTADLGIFDVGPQQLYYVWSLLTEKFESKLEL